VSVRSAPAPAPRPGVGGPGPTSLVPNQPSRMSPKAQPPAPLALAAILLALALCAVAPAIALAARSSRGSPVEIRTTLPAIESQAMCVTCKIPLTVAQSAQADRERVFIQHLIDQGLTEAQIKRVLVREYGPTVLALPSSHGFDLTVYLVPPLVVLALLGLLALLLPRWRRRARAAGDPARPPAALSAADAARLDADIARFD
jgi:cytochrome c-type biogenesis protein CcmH